MVLLKVLIRLNIDVDPNEVQTMSSLLSETRVWVHHTGKPVFRVITGVYCDKHITHTYAVWKNAKIFNITAGGTYSYC